MNEKGRLSAVLFQLLESFHYTNDNRIYLAKLIAEFEGFPVMIEFRHKEWIRESGREGKKVQVYFNNHPNGSGAKNGLKLKEMVAENCL